jgi:hypothetical protein
MNKGSFLGGRLCQRKIGRRSRLVAIHMRFTKSNLIVGLVAGERHTSKPILRAEQI